jgi:hypothetical protein
MRRAFRRYLLSRLLSSEQKDAIGFLDYGYLKDTGWTESWRRKSPVDAAGRPVPWMNYSLVAFLEPRLTPAMSLFEYGSGASTVYFAGKVGRVTSIEHDRTWYEDVRARLPANAAIHHEALEYGGRYCRAIAEHGGRYHIVVVDGRDRVNCVKHAVDRLEEDGVIILDDAERCAYKPGAEFLAERGFRRLEFWGLTPGNPANKCGIIFYRPGNCLGI